MTAGLEGIQLLDYWERSALIRKVQLWETTYLLGSTDTFPHFCTREEAKQRSKRDSKAVSPKVIMTSVHQRRESR